jgi:tetratricopeptide (TPR) repeat protein
VKAVRLPLALCSLFVGLTFAPRAEADAPSLTAVAAASSRPRECSASLLAKGRKKKPSVWARARVPELGPYCDALSEVHVLLETEPQRALELAQKAETLWPDHAGALVAQGRAHLALGKPAEALVALDRAKTLDPLSLEDPKSMRAHARALVLTGKIAEGAALYRTLVPRASLLSERQRVLVLMEAAFATMAVAPSPRDSTTAARAEALGEAIAFISEARSTASGVLLGDALLAAALIHDRAGEAEKSAALLAESRSLTTAGTEAKACVAAQEDAVALSALAQEVSSPSEAQRAWINFAETTKNASFGAAARARAANLRTPAAKSSKARRAG